MRSLAVLAMASLMALAACGFVPRPPRVCDQLSSDTCRGVAAAVLADPSLGHPVSLVVVNGYRGCLPLPISCPLMPAQVSSPTAALVAVQFSDGADSVVRHVPDVSARPLVVEGFDSLFADALIDTHTGAPRE